MSKRIVVIGNGQFAVSCLKLLLCAGVVVPLVIADPELYVLAGLLPAFCRKMKLPLIETTNINSPDTLDAVSKARPDFLFSIYNMRIIRQALLRLARIATVNFHNGPLPRYRGVNIYSWAIINGEREHGVTWHKVDEGIDTGDILGQKMFPLEQRDTPVTLLSKGFRAGTELLETMLPDLIDGRIKGQKQDESLATSYSKKDLPNDGRIRFDWTFDQIERFVRGLDFRPFENRFVRPTAVFNGARFYPQTVRHVSNSCTRTPGSVLDIQDDLIEVQAADSVVALSHLLDEQSNQVTTRQLQQSLKLETGALLS
jgi:methionyl-tRNA formyltransferase